MSAYATKKGPAASGYVSEMANTLNSVPVEYLFTVHATVGAPVVIPNGPAGTRLVIEVTGGTVSGPQVNGVVNMGGDWATLRANGTAGLDVRLLLTTNDGDAIHMTYEGVLSPTDGGMRIITAPRFQTGSEKLAWLNDVQAIAFGAPGENCVDYDVYRVL